VNGSQVVPFLGFGVNGAPSALAGSPNSTIKVPQGWTLKITLTQSGAAVTDPLHPIELSFPSLPAGDVINNLDGTYTVTASKVGTSVFQPGSNTDAPKEVAMGLVGVLIVTPTGCVSATLSCAYDGTVYSDETLVATTDLDYEFATNAATFAEKGMGYFGQPVDPSGAARKVYHVVNGQSFPDTQMIDVRATDSLLIRSVNAGVSDKSMSLLGLRQTLLARNSSPYIDAQTFIAPLVGPGETADLVVNIPGTAVVGQQYALIDAGRQMNHGNAYGFGGALTFLTVWPA
jgi:FtsP/CotA-like multicopper oxidase with cupredoxin domain